MSQRLSSTRKHPITGEDIAPLWFDQNGIAFYPLMGAAPDDDDEDGDDEDGSDDDGDDGDGGEDGSEGQDKSGNGGKITQEQFEALEKRMKAADKRASEAEKRAKALEDKDKDEATKTAERLTEVEAELKAAKETVSDLTLKNAFLSSNDVAWHDPDVALSNADLSEVLQDDGTVDKKALKKALEDLSKSKPFLVKPKEDGDDKDEPSGPTGVNAGSGKKHKKEALDEQRLREKYPALYA